MSDVTTTNGAIYMDQDTGQPVNPGNIDTTKHGVAYKLGSMFQPGATVEPPLPPKDVQDLVMQIQVYRRMTLMGAPNDRGRALVNLRDLAATEYGRKDGGRLEVKQALNAAGVEKPKGT